MADAPTNSKQRAAVEQIVRQVLAELRAAGSATSSQARGIPSPGTPSPNTLTLSTKVITATVLEGRLTAGTQLIVPRGAVFTPSARDELKKYRVTVASAVGSATGNGKFAAKARLQLAAYGKVEPTPLAAGLSADGLEVQRVAATDLPAIIALLAQQLSTSRGLLVTDETALAVCLANRTPGVRAALIGKTAEIDRAASSLSPNLLVVDPEGRSVFELRQLVRHWLRSPEPACPAALAPYLN